MSQPDDLLKSLEHLSAPQLRRLLTEQLTRQKLGLYWESSALARDAALNANIVLPRLVEADSHGLAQLAGPGTPNLIIEGDNFDSLRLLKSTHAGKIRVIYIDPPYNTGNKDWVYNDRFVGANDRWRHSQWLEFLYRRLLLARDLLSQDGVIMVSINDENRSRLELLMDEVFPGRRVGSFVWRSRTGGNDAKGAFFSDNHEHVLVYGNSGFRFSGDEKSYSMYRFQEGERVFRLSDLTKAHDMTERRNTYYPIHDPKTDIYYPCNPQRVWAYASKLEIHSRFNGDEAAIAVALKGLRGDAMEDLAEKGLIWFPPNQRIETFETLEALRTAVSTKDVPLSGKTPLLFEGMPNLEFWVGKKIGYGRPQFKRFKEGLKNENQPISSWLTPRQEDHTLVEGENLPVVGTTEEGSKELQDLMGSKAFPYPKPRSLIENLLAQASRPGDTVLDFFAGSGTTGHAVLALNALDGGNRKFILCSSTEATAKEPTKNLCRDVCAARISKVIESDAALSGNSFAYLQLDKIAPGDAPFDSSCAQAFQLLTLRLGQVARPVPAIDRGVKVLVQNTGDGSLTVLCHKLTRATLDALAALPGRQLRVYSTRPATVREHFQTLGREVESLSLARALLHGQQGGRARRSALTLPPDATYSIAAHAIGASAGGQKGTQTMSETPSENAVS
jgi:adenine-specific DNA-methyltransferase